MTTAALPAPRRRPRARLLAARAGKATAALGARLIAPHRAVLANLRAIPLTVAGLGCADAAGFVHSVFAGLIVTGASLILLEHLIADEGR